MVKKKRTYNIKLIKSMANYSVRDVADLYQTYKGTVLNWKKEGLQPIDEKKPYLFMGYALNEFLQNRQKKRKQKCQPDELYCCKCHVPRKSWENLVDLKSLTVSRLQIIGVCDVCGTATFKAGSAKKLDEIKVIFKVQKIDGKDLRESVSPIVNSDIKEVN